MLFTFLFVVQALVAAGLVGVILMQKSEGGGLGMGGSPSGLMSARGAADFLTRMTSILATAFVSLAIVLAVLAATRQTQRVTATAPAPAAPVTAPGAPSPLGAAPSPLGPQKSAAQVAAEAEAKTKPAANATAPVTGNSAVPIER
ncbi:MAG: preprotein translocase subunit SecG [Sphingomonas sp.]|nr:preprotein translocase subunit SecG [Sphingomonas sp.]